MMMLDKQKLLQWVEDQLYVFSGPYNDNADMANCKSKINILRVLEMEVNADRFDVTKEG